MYYDNLYKTFIKPLRGKYSDTMSCKVTEIAETGGLGGG